MLDDLHGAPTPPAPPAACAAPRTHIRPWQGGAREGGEEHQRPALYAHSTMASTICGTVFRAIAVSLSGGGGPVGHAWLTSRGTKATLTQGRRSRRIPAPDRRRGTAWGIKTIGGYDVPKRQRTLRRKQKAREREARRRRGHGARPQSQSLSRTKPWAAEGVSRRKWYRLRQRETTAQREAAE
jgi:hypothetical protein